MSELITMVVDIKDRRPGCAILQAYYGTPNNEVLHLFDADTWVLAPTPNLHKITGTMDQWRNFANECNARYRK